MVQKGPVPRITTRDRREIELTEIERRLDSIMLHIYIKNMTCSQQLL